MARKTLKERQRRKDAVKSIVNRYDTRSPTLIKTILENEFGIVAYQKAIKHDLDELDLPGMDSDFKVINKLISDLRKLSGKEENVDRRISYFKELSHLLLKKEKIKTEIYKRKNIEMAIGTSKPEIMVTFGGDKSQETLEEELLNQEGLKNISEISNKNKHILTSLINSCDNDILKFENKILDIGFLKINM